MSEEVHTCRQTLIIIRRPQQHFFHLSRLLSRCCILTACHSPLIRNKDLYIEKSLNSTKMSSTGSILSFIGENERSFSVTLFRKKFHIFREKKRGARKRRKSHFTCFRFSSSMLLDDSQIKFHDSISISCCVRTEYA